MDKTLKSLAVQGIEPNGGGALSSKNVSKLGSKEVSKKLRNFYFAIKKRRSVAFTLAEVLITLGIIGVVAALTLPSIINKFQMKTFEVAFKKEYSVLNNTIDYLQLEENINDCYLKLSICPTATSPNNTCYKSVDADCSALKQGLVNKLKLTQISKSDISYPKREQVLKDGGVAVNVTASYDAAQAYSSAFLLPDGAILMFAQIPYSNSPYSLYFILDVNGKKGPNKWGYDVFFLTLSQKNGKLRLTDEYASISQKGGRLPRTILLNKDSDSKYNGWLW